MFDDSFFAYLDQLQLLAFFSGYPLVYLLIRFIAHQLKDNRFIKTDLVAILPLAYAISGVLYIGLFLKNIFPDYSGGNLVASLHSPWLQAWGFISVLFFLPVLRKRPFLSFLHSLVFFSLIIRDLYLYLFSTTDPNPLRNDMRIYSDSLLLGISIYAILLLLAIVYNRVKKGMK